MRIVIADDSALVREGVARILADAGMEVAGTFADGGALESRVEQLAPDVAILDIRMPPTFTDEGVRLAARLREVLPALAILLLSQQVETRSAVQLIRDHPQGFGYLLKDRVVDIGRFVEDVRRVAAGGTVMDPEVVSRLLQRQARRDTIETLSEREREVLGLLATGRSNGGIARALVLGPKTIESHVAAIFGKLGLENGADENRRVLAVLAYLEGRVPGKP